MRACVCACAFLISVHARPEAAVLDWYGPEADPLRILARGGGGGGGDSRYRSGGK